MHYYSYTVQDISIYPKLKINALYRWIFFSFSHRYYTFDINDLTTKLSKKIKVGESAKLLQKLSFRTKYLSYEQIKKYPPLPNLWEIRDKK